MNLTISKLSSSRMPYGARELSDPTRSILLTSWFNTRVQLNVPMGITLDDLFHDYQSYLAKIDGKAKHLSKPLFNKLLQAILCEEEVDVKLSKRPKILYYGITLKQL